jgi:hypothetical protein
MLNSEGVFICGVDRLSAFHRFNDSLCCNGISPHRDLASRTWLQRVDFRIVTGDTVFDLLRTDVSFVLAAVPRVSGDIASCVMF